MRPASGIFLAAAIVAGTCSVTDAQEPDPHGDPNTGVLRVLTDPPTRGQCSQCREGTEWLHQIFARLERGQGRMADIELLSSLANGMAPAKTICALSDAAAIPTHAIVRHFRAELEQHVRLGRCPLGSQQESPELEEAHA